MKKKNIALIAGGYSGEYEISINSAKLVEENIDSSKYTIYKIIIQKDTWHYLSPEMNQIEVDKNDFSINVGDKKIKFDGAFIIIHGTPGEDGILQSYFDLIGLPYQTCSAGLSSLTFNKHYCNSVINQMKVKVPKGLLINKNNMLTDEGILSFVGLPCIVKPNNGGSSIGISLVEVKSKLTEAILLAFEQDKEVLIEEFIKGREITCGLYRKGKELKVLPLTEIISQKSFFDYEAKYLGKSNEVTPAELSEKWAIQCKSISAMIYNQLNCKGVVRIDYIFDGKQFYFLEVNTVPGQSAQSIIPQQIRAMGWEVSTLYNDLIDEMFVPQTQNSTPR